MTFAELGLSPNLVQALADLEITAPTPIQTQALPPMVAGESLMLQSQTGQGKTLAYLLPLYQRQTLPLEKGAQAIILVPTRELAMQVHHTVQDLSQRSGILLKSIALFGDVNINKQMDKLKEKPQIIIGTADRILALIQKKKIPAHQVKTMIIDEADRLLHPDNVSGVKAVRKCLMKYTQMVFVSATYGPKDLIAVENLAPGCTQAKTQVKDEIPPEIVHHFVLCPAGEKQEVLRKLLNALKLPKCMVFLNELEDIAYAVSHIQDHGQAAIEAIHGNSTKEERKKRVQAFSEGKLPVLIATDLAARGLHVEGIDCVISVNLPEDPTDYLHRAGRTGRTGARGLSILLAAPHELPQLTRYQKRYGVRISELKLSHGQLRSTEPDGPFVW